MKDFFKFLVMLFVVSGLLSISSCNKDEQEVIIEKFSQAKMDMSNAEQLAVLESSPSNSNGNLYKLTTNGTMEEVKFISSDGSEVSEKQTSSIIDVTSVIRINDEFLNLKGNFQLWDTLGNSLNYYSILVRINDGAIFNFPSQIINSTFHFANETKIPSDNSGNFYYMGSVNYNSITKMNIQNPDNVTTEQYSATGQEIAKFETDKNGNCIYRTVNIEEYKIQKSNGGIYLVEPNEYPQNTSLNIEIDNYWIGTNGLIYVMEGGYYNPNIRKISINQEGNVSDDIVWLGNGTTNPNNYQFYFNGANEGWSKIYCNNEVIFIPDQSEYYKGWKYKELNDEIEFASLPIWNEVKAITNSLDYVYIGYGTSIIKLSILDLSYTEIIQNGEYEIYTLSVDINEVVTFSALRYSDGKKVVGTINDSNIEIIDEENDKEILSLERLD